MPLLSGAAKGIDCCRRRAPFALKSSIHALYNPNWKLTVGWTSDETLTIGETLGKHSDATGKGLGALTQKRK